MDQAERERIWNAWLAKRPPEVAAVAGRCPPWSLYLHKPTNLKVLVVGFDEPAPDEPGSVTLIIDVLEQYNGPHVIERRVYDILPDELEVIDEGEP